VTRISAMRIAVRVIEDSQREATAAELAANLGPEMPVDVAFDPVTSAMLIAAVELWQGERNPDGDPRPSILAHAVQLGLALLFQSNDHPDTYNPPHDGCLDLIDELRGHLGFPPLGDEPMGLLKASKEQHQ
jgi:hypothetical protein